jgi:glycogen(starch) synthase
VKVLVVSNLYPPEVLGGYELGCAQVVEGLRRRGHKVVVLTTPSTAEGGDAVSIRRDLQLAPVYNPQRFAPFSSSTWRHVLAASNFVNAGNTSILAEALQVTEPDVVYLWNLFGLGGLGLLACLAYTETPWVWHLMDAVPAFLCSLSAPHTPGQGPVHGLATAFGKSISGSYIACSQRVVDEVTSFEIELRDSIHLVPNWINGTLTSKRTDFFRGGHLRVVYAGQLGQHKGIDLLVEAASRLLSRGYANFSLDIYGLGDDSVVQALVNGSGLRGIVNLMGEQPASNLLGLYKSYDVFAFPTWRREPFAFAPLEAAAQGCVPLISADSGNAEWFVNGVHCLKAARDADAFATRLVEVLDGRIDLEGLARRTQAVVWSDFHLDSVLPRIESILEDAAGRRSLNPGDPGDLYALARLAEGLVGRFVDSP